MFFFARLYTTTNEQWEAVFDKLLKGILNVESKGECKMKKLIVWMAALALLAIGGQAYAEEGSSETAGREEMLMPEANPADRGGAQWMVENKNAAYELASEQKNGISVAKENPRPIPKVTVGDDGLLTIGGKPYNLRPGPSGWELDPVPPKPTPAPPKPPSRTDPNFDPDARPLS